MGAFFPKLRKKPPLGRIFRTFGICFTTVYVLIWTVREKLVHDVAHVQDCITSFFQSAWFGILFLLQPSSAPNRGRTAQRKKRLLLF